MHHRPDTPDVHLSHIAAELFGKSEALVVVDALVLKWNIKATEIQRIVRGIQDRARVVIVRIRRDAAVKIQSLMRGEVARITTTHGVYWCVRRGLGSQVHNLHLKFTQASQAYVVSIIPTDIFI